MRYNTEYFVFIWWNYFQFNFEIIKIVFLDMKCGHLFFFQRVPNYHEYYNSYLLLFFQVAFITVKFDKLFVS